MISAAQLDKRIRLEQRIAGQDALGQPMESWALVTTLWASIRHASGLQTIKAGVDASIVRASIRIRYRADVDANQRVVHGGVIYGIQAVLPNQREGYIDLVCEVVE